MGSALVGTANQFTGILRREIYVDQVIWNRRRMKKVPGTSRRIAEIRPESEWIIHDHPELRIIEDRLWNRVQARLRQSREKAHKNNKRPLGRPSKYLLSGLMKCGECGAGMVGTARSHNPVHRTRQSVGKRLQRKLQRQATRRAA